MGGAVFFDVETALSQSDLRDFLLLLPIESRLAVDCRSANTIFLLRDKEGLWRLASIQSVDERPEAWMMATSGRSSLPYP